MSFPSPAQEGTPSVLPPVSTESPVSEAPVTESRVSESRVTVQPAASANDASALNVADNTVADNSEVDPAQNRFWGIFFSTFLTIFLAEIGDKTQLTTLLMTAESHAPWVVFAGAGSALILTSLLGVLLGQWLATRVEPKMLDRAAGLTLLSITVWLLWDVWQG